MTIFIAFSLGLIGILISFIAFRRWFNHVSLYTSIWSGTIILFESRLINYYPIELETWVIIVGCWLIFMAGAITVVIVRDSSTDRSFYADVEVNSAGDEQRIKRLYKILWILNIVTFLAAIYNLYLVSRLAGGLSNAFVFGNLLYSHRVSEGLPGSIPYIASLVFTAALLAGSYTAQKERIALVSVLPFLIIIMIDFANMGRADILIVALLFASGYFLMRRIGEADASRPRLRLRKVVMALLLAGIVVGGADFIRSTRKAQEGFRGSTAALRQLRYASVITPSIYLYLSASHGVLNRYIQGGGENTPIGGNSLLPVYRILERIGVEVHASVYQSWYKTPAHLNTGTYLRELHGDFGMLGILVGPYILGVLSSVFWFRIQKHHRYVDLTVGGFLFTIVGMSFFVMPTRVSPFFVYLFVCWVISRYIDGGPSQKVA